jgi:hypothetical protein
MKETREHLGDCVRKIACDTCRMSGMPRRVKAGTENAEKDRSERTNNRNAKINPEVDQIKEVAKRRDGETVPLGRREEDREGQ